MKSLEELRLEKATKWMLSHVVPASKYSGIPASAMASNLMAELDAVEVDYWEKRAIVAQENMAYERGLDANHG